MNDFLTTLRLIAETKLAHVLGTAVQLIGNGVMEYTPVEDGHAHTAWKVGFEQVPGVKVTAPPGASNDPKALAAGSATFSLTGPEQRITVSNDLDFVRKIEYGLEITPIAPGGRKLNPVLRPPGIGPLYGPRDAAGVGLVVWKDASGTTHKARSMTPPAGHYVGRAITNAKTQLKSMYQGV